MTMCAPLEDHPLGTPSLSPASAVSPRNAATATSAASHLRVDSTAIRTQLDDWNRNIHRFIHDGAWDAAIHELRELQQWMDRTIIGGGSGTAFLSLEERRRLSAQFDAAVQSWIEMALAEHGTQRQAYFGMQVLHLQGNVSAVLEPPYHLVPKRTLLLALKRLTALPVSTKDAPLEDDNDVDDSPFHPPDAAFRILQRLITGVGVRTRTPAVIMEHDFNRVIHAFVQADRLDRAHAVVALQERVTHAPPLSAVTLSILLKGHGKFGDLSQVEQIIQMAQSHSIQPDIVMANALLDAFVNCEALDQARELFHAMTTHRSNVNHNPFALPFPRANARTHNIYLKGLANAGRWTECDALSKRMQNQGWWDAVTTNTLVHAAILSGHLDQAEQLLAEHTVIPSGTTTHTGSHPNVEAYTELIDTYAKKGQLKQAVSMYQVMRERGIDPNEITFTCLIAGFGRAHQLDQARKMLAYMPTVGVVPSSITYNALISAMVDPLRGESLERTADREFCGTVVDATVDEALRVLRDMIQSGVRPNAVTVATLVTAFGNCHPPRVREGKLLVHKLESERLIPTGHPKVVTSLMQTCGIGGDAVGAVEAFRRLKHVDTMAVNVFLDVCCRCNRDRMALDTFDYYFRRKSTLKRPLKPDTVSYSILIQSLLNDGKDGSIRRVYALYHDLKRTDGLRPDKTLIDAILKPMVRRGQRRTLSSDESSFVMSVLRDAEQLQWDDGQLERRKRAVRAVVGSKLRDVWLSDKTGNPEIDLFQRKGWNQVDSGFRLLGLSPDASTSTTKPTKKKVVDRFLESKGWNDVDSGFRII